MFGKNFSTKKELKLLMLRLAVKATGMKKVCKEAEFSTTTRQKTGGADQECRRTCRSVNRVAQTQKSSMTSVSRTILSTVRSVTQIVIVADFLRSVTQSSWNI